MIEFTRMYIGLLNISDQFANALLAYTSPQEKIKSVCHSVLTFFSLQHISVDTLGLILPVAQTVVVEMEYPHHNTVKIIKIHGQ